MRAADPLFTFHAIPMIVLRLASRGIDPKRALRDAGLAEGPLDAPMIAPLSRHIAFLDAAAELLGDPMLGITLADAVPETLIGYPVFTARSASTLREGLVALCELGPLINPIVRFSLEVKPPLATLEYVVQGRAGGLGRHLNEHSLSLTVRYTTEAIAGGLPITRAWVPHREDIGRSELERRLRCTVELGAGSMGFAFASDLLDIRPVGANEPLFRFLWEQGKRLVDAVSTDDVIAAIIRVIEPRLEDASLDLKKVAKLLAMSERSLQRRLTDAGSSYREVLDHVRHRRFLHLRRGGLALDRCARELGFADVRGLRRATERWES